MTTNARLDSGRRIPLWVMTCVAAWSVVPTLAGHIGAMGAGAFLFWSNLVSTLTLAATALSTGKGREFRYYSSADLRRLVALGGLGIFLSYTLLYSAYAPCGAGLPCAQKMSLLIIVQYTWPAFTVLLSWILLSEQASWRAPLSLLCGVLAVATVAVADVPGHVSTGAIPKALGAAAAFGLYSTLAKPFAYEPLTGTTLMFASATIMSLASLLVTAMASGHRTVFHVDLGTAMVVILNGALVNSLSFLCWRRALGETQAGGVTPWVCLAPMAAAVVYASAYPVTLRPAHWLGLGLVVASVLFALLPRRPRPEPRSRVVGSRVPPPRRLVEESF